MDLKRFTTWLLLALLAVCGGVQAAPPVLDSADNGLLVLS